MKLGYPRITITRRDNGWSYLLESSAATATDAVHVDGSPLVLKFWAPKGLEGEDFTLTLEEDAAEGE